MFNQVDPGINQLIGSYLDYESRINFGRVLPDVESKFVKRLDSDSHNTYVKHSLLRDKLARFEATGMYTIERCKALKRLFLYILHTKDEVLFKNAKLIAAIRDTAMRHSDPNAYVLMLARTHRKELNSCVRVATMLVSYLDTKTPSEWMKSGRPVEII